jgi:nitrite reductase/ring-hydroxylating ferredoxin subunit
MRRIHLAATREVPEGTTLRFQFTRAGRKVDGFLARFKGRFVAYENECRHLPITLDFGNHEFFTADGRYFFCQTHGALFEPLTGLCVRGSCAGSSLKALTVEVNRGTIWLLVKSQQASS